MHQGENLILKAQRSCGGLGCIGHVGIAGDPGKLARDAFRTEYEIHDPRGNGAVRHAILLGAVVLREGDAADLLDGSKSHGAVGGGSREHHADGVMALVGRERRHEQVDRVVRPCFAGAEAEATLANDHRAAGRDDVYPVRLDLWLVTHLAHRHGGRPGEDLGEHARMPRAQVWDEHDAESGVGGHFLQQGGEGFQPPGRGADAHDAHPCARRVTYRCADFGGPGLAGRAHGRARIPRFF